MTFMQIPFLTVPAMFLNLIQVQTNNAPVPTPVNWMAFILQLILTVWAVLKWAESKGLLKRRKKSRNKSKSSPNS